MNEGQRASRVHVSLTAIGGSFMTIAPRITAWPFPLESATNNKQEQSGAGMAAAIGYDGKFLWQGANLGSRSGHGIHTRQLLKEMMECWPTARIKVYAICDEPGVDLRPNCQAVTLPRYA